MTEAFVPLAIAPMLPENDRASVCDARMRAMLTTDFVAGSWRGYHAQLHDWLAYGRDWGFSLRAIHVPVHLVWGELDEVVPLHHAEHMRALLPRATLTVIDGGGHFAGFMQPERVLEWTLPHLCG